MAFDGMMTHAITQELKENIQSGKINKIYQPSAREIHLHIRAQGQNYKLLLSANPTYPRVHLSSQQVDNPAHAPMFCMVLRKHVEGGIIERIEQVGKERIIHLDIRSRNELGDLQLKRLVLEIMGRHSNLMLIDPEKQMIIDSIHYVSPSMSQHRTVLPGRAYISPPDQEKVDPFTLDEQTFIKKLNFNQGKLEQQIVQQFTGISPLLAQEILFQASLG